MKIKNFLTIVFLYFFIIVSPSLAVETVIFEDNFNNEPTDRWVYNYDNFGNWDIKDGYVDLLNSNHYGFEHLVDYGYFVDLDGTNLDDTYPTLGAGRMESKQTFNFIPGYTYCLEFDLAGSQAFWLPHSNTVTVTLGDIYNQVITLDTYDPFMTFQNVFDVSSPTSARLIFDHSGNDQVGLLLDNIVIYSYSNPETIIDAILTFFDQSVADGSLTGYGHGNSANGRLNALRNILETVSDLIDIDDIEGACRQLRTASRKSDGIAPPPPDFVAGSAVSKLHTMITELMAELGCE